MKNKIIEARKVYEQMNKTNRILYFDRSIREYIREKTGEYPALVGSVAMEVDLPTSDIDYAIKVKKDEKLQMKKQLEKFMEFRGERPARLESTRYLFRFIWRENIRVDLNVMDEYDYEILLEGIEKAKRTMTYDDKALFVYNKLKLHEKSLQDYEEYKLALYRKFCPQLLWMQDIDICKLVQKEYSKKGIDLPQWLVEKLEKENIGEDRNEDTDCRE